MKTILAIGLLVACALLGGSSVGSCVNAVRFAALDAVDALKASDREFRRELATRERKKAARVEASQYPTRLERH